MLSCFNSFFSIFFLLPFVTRSWYTIWPEHSLMVDDGSRGIAYLQQFLVNDITESKRRTGWQQRRVPLEMDSALCGNVGYCCARPIMTNIFNGDRSKWNNFTRKTSDVSDVIIDLSFGWTLCVVDESIFKPSIWGLLLDCWLTEWEGRLGSSLLRLSWGTI